LAHFRDMRTRTARNYRGDGDISYRVQMEGKLGKCLRRVSKRSARQLQRFSKKRWVLNPETWEDTGGWC
jgi:hypothetical protein